MLNAVARPPAARGALDQASEIRKRSSHLNKRCSPIDHQRFCQL